MNNLWDRGFISSAEVIAANEDLITEILLHLPVKSLVRFKCVSKEWFNLISNRYFSCIHTRRNSALRTSSLLMLKGGHHYPMIRLSLGHENTSSVASFRIPSFNAIPDITMRILGISNGLTLSYLSSAINDYNFAYCVCNLATKRYTILPRPGLIINKPILGLNLAFDPSKSPHFKVVCIGQSGCMMSDGNCQIEIYSSETGLWRRWNSSFFNTFHPLEIFDRGVFCNGALHWLCTKSDSIYFVIEDESLKTLPMPPIHGDIYTTKISRYLGQSGGHLHLVHIESNTYRNPPMDIYEMKKDYSGWFLKCRVDVDDIVSAYPEVVAHVHIPGEYFGKEDSINLSRYYSCTVLTVVRGREEDEQGLEIVLSLPPRIISYNPKNNSMKVLMSTDKGVLDYCWDDVYQFSETLSWL